MIHRILFCFVVLLISPSLFAVQRLPTLEWENSVNTGGGAKAPIELQDGTLLASLSQADANGVYVVCLKSTDSGETWKRMSTIVRDQDKRVDLGDGHFLQLPGGDVLYSYRHIRYLDLRPAEHTFEIKIAVSQDGGETWSSHSTVMSSLGRVFAGGAKGSVGLWSSFLLQTSKGVLQCYYDDEITPYDKGLRGHQWITMKTWNPKRRVWQKPVTVSRARESKHLSRDGSCAVVEIAQNQLLVALESVQVEPPHRSLVRYVTSQDGGRTWSWKRQGRSVLYETTDKRFNVGAPWIVRLSNGTLVCVFHTDEDRATPDVPSTGILDESLKYVTAAPGGCRWSSTPGILDSGHPIRLPGIIELRHGPNQGKLLAMYIHDGEPRTKIGSMVPSDTRSIRGEADSGEDSERAVAFVEFTTGEISGKAEGQNILIRNTHPSRSIRVRLSKNWCKGSEQKSKKSTVVLRPGDDRAKNLGNSNRRVSAKEFRFYEWVILSAEFL